MDMCTGCCHITEILLKMALNTIQSIKLLVTSSRSYVKVTVFEKITIVGAFIFSQTHLVLYSACSIVLQTSTRILQIMMFG